MTSPTKQYSQPRFEPNEAAPQKEGSCNGPKIGLYSWDQMAKHLAGKNARTHTCSDVYINVADSSKPNRIYSSYFKKSQLVLHAC